MKLSIAPSLFILISSIVFSLNASAAFETIDPTASVVNLRTSCTENNVALNNCFTYLSSSPGKTSSLIAWMQSVRKPNSTSPLQVNIGPGTFSRMGITCDPTNGYNGFISFRGAGRDATTIDLGNSPTAIASCDKLNFSDIGFTGGYAYIVWSGGGSSAWHNVDINLGARAWLEQGCGATKGKHYWFNSRIYSKSQFSVADTYNSSCDESWFYASEIGVSLEEPTPGAAHVFNLDQNGEVHVYGSVIRALASGAGTATQGLVAVLVSSSTAMMHIHGTGIDVISSNPNDLVALSVANGGMIHANGAAYNLSTPSGTVTRIKKDQDARSHVHAPYLWEHIPDPATIPNFTSVTGADMAPLTTGTSDGHPHFVMYDATCTSKWYDTVDKACKP